MYTLFLNPSLDATKGERSLDSPASGAKTVKDALGQATLAHPPFG
jgi:hypothetical protein